MLEILKEELYAEAKALYPNLTTKQFGETCRSIISKKETMSIQEFARQLWNDLENKYHDEI